MADTYSILIELADRYIGLGQAALRRGVEVLPVAVGVWPDGSTQVAGIAGPCSAADRAKVLRALALAGADGVLFFGDINLRDARTYAKIGDALHAYIELKDGRTTARVCKYTPDPLTFEPIVSPDRGTAVWIHPIFDRTTH